MANRETQEDSHGRPAQFHTLKSELIYSPRTSRPLQPHVFERARATQRHTRVPHRESPILPRTNPFANPRRGLIDAIVPVLRFATLVALFTAAGTWLQMTFHNQPVATPTKSPKATVQHPAASAAKTVDRPVQPPTAVGPVGTTPESGTKVGRVRENDDFARLRGDILPVKPELSNTSEFALRSLVRDCRTCNSRSCRMPEEATTRRTRKILLARTT